MLHDGRMVEWFRFSSPHLVYVVPSCSELWLSLQPHNFTEEGDRIPRDVRKGPSPTVKTTSGANMARHPRPPPLFPLFPLDLFASALQDSKITIMGPQPHWSHTGTTRVFDA